MLRRGGIDEAGYGPLLGPLSIAAAMVEVDDGIDLDRELRHLGADDSKALHDPGNLGRLEAVALAIATWLSGSEPTTAAQLFALFAETGHDRDQPWMDGADTLTLPIAARTIPRWTIPGARPLGIYGRLIHPAQLNREAAGGQNRAAVEWTAIGALLVELARHGSATATVDRLGGRRYYRDPLAAAFPTASVAIVEELPQRSAYRVEATTGTLDVAFLVKADAHDALVGAASCVAKYAREVHQHLFNRWWTRRHPTVAPTAGYGSDAKRWIDAIGVDDRTAFGNVLIRGWY